MCYLVYLPSLFAFVSIIRTCSRTTNRKTESRTLIPHPIERGVAVVGFMDVSGDPICQALSLRLTVFVCDITAQLCK